jgi:hypothetical protein
MVARKTEKEFRLSGDKKIAAGWLGASASIIDAAIAEGALVEIEP